MYFWLARLFINRIAWPAFFCGSILSANPHPATNGVSFSITYRRQLEATPCDCSLYPVGGMAREYNLLNIIRKSSSSPLKPLTIGTSFVPEPNQFLKKQLSKYSKKASKLVDAMNLLETYVFIPGGGDLMLSAPRLKMLQKQAKFKFVTANVVSKKSRKLLFDAYTELKVGSLQIVLIGLTDSVEQKYPEPPKDVSVLPYRDALKKVIDNLPKSSDRVLLVAGSFGFHERKELAKEFPQAVFWLGGDDFDNQKAQYDQPELNWAFGTTESNGKRLLLLELISPKSKYDMLFSPSHQTVLQSRIGYLGSEIAKVEKDSFPKKTERLEFLRNDLKDTETFLKLSGQAKVRFDYHFTDYSINPKQDLPVNPITRLFPDPNH